MTRDELKTGILAALEDAGLVHFLDIDLNDSILDGYQIIALLTQCIEKVIEIPFVGQKNFYNFQEIIPAYYRVWAIYNTSSRKWLYPNVLESFKEFNLRWQLQHGEPREFAVCGANYIALFPKPASSVGSMLVFYKAWPTTLTGTDTFQFPSTLHSALEDYTISDLHLQDLEYSKSKIFQEHFDFKLERITEFVNHRALPDRIYSLTCPSSQTLISSD